MKILAIETSCDDTSIALIEARGKKRVSFNIPSNIVSSQIELHKKWGGVYPTLAKREHQKNLLPVLKKALKRSKLFKSQKANLKQRKTLEKILEREPDLLKEFIRTLSKIKKPKIDAIAITQGPGLEPCLWVGINFARALAFIWNLPIIPVNHIEAHLYSSFVNNKKIAFPAIALIVSGGHTQLILMKDFGKYKIIGETRDDAAGECLDKIARILGLEYPGGPIIEKRAKKSNYATLPRPMINTKDLDFSFSGLKTAALYEVKKHKKKSKDYVYHMCYETQQAVIDVLIKKTLKAAKKYEAQTVILGGGVTTNKELRKQMKKAIQKEMPEVELNLPSPSFCTDNAAMIGIAAFFNQKKGNWKNLKAEANLRLGK